MKDIFSAALNEMEIGRPTVLVSVIASSGSTPRAAGASMLVFADGSSIGTIGGGRVEYEAQKHAAELCKTGASAVTSYKLYKNEAMDLGMICGGDVTVYYQYLSGAGNERGLFDYIAGASRDKSLWLLRKITDRQSCETALWDCEGLKFASTITEAEIEPLLTNKPVLIEGEPMLYAEPLFYAGKTFVFGGGHVAQELVPLIARLGFNPVVYEDREDFAKPELFPGVQSIVLADFNKIFENCEITKDDYVVIMTRGHQADFEVLEQVLKTPAPYVGCIGSRSKVAATKKRLLEAGVTQEEIDRLHSPIGLTIKAETPAEIAVSIAGELILFKNSERQ